MNCPKPGGISLDQAGQHRRVFSVPTRPHLPAFHYVVDTVMGKQGEKFVVSTFFLEG